MCKSIPKIYSIKVNIPIVTAKLPHKIANRLNLKEINNPPKPQIRKPDAVLYCIGTKLGST